MQKLNTSDELLVLTVCSVAINDSNREHLTKFFLTHRQHILRICFCDYPCVTSTNVLISPWA